MKSKKSSRQRRSHAARRPFADAWDVAMDALLEHDLEKAAEVVSSILWERDQRGEIEVRFGSVERHATPEFVKALKELPRNVLDRFGKTLREEMLRWLPPPGRMGSPSASQYSPGKSTLTHATKKKSSAQLDREIATWLAARSNRARHSTRTHHTTKPQDSGTDADAYDVAHDALLEGRPERAAEIVAELSKEVDVTPTFLLVMLEHTPTNVRDRFLKSLRRLGLPRNR